MSTDWFEWNGTKCTAYGIHVSEHAPIMAAKERSSTVSVPGRSGTLTTTEGEDIYDDINITEKCFMSTPKHITQISGWLKGQGILRVANRPEGFYRARVVNQIEFEKIIRGSLYRTFNVQFRCDPFFYINDVPKLTLTRSGTSVKNVYDFKSFPTITVNGTGDVSVSVSGIRVSIDNMTRPVTIDTEPMLAYYIKPDGSIENEGNKVTLDDDEWPVLQPGANTITWTGNVSSIVVEPNWRCR